MWTKQFDNMAPINGKPLQLLFIRLVVYVGER